MKKTFLFLMAFLMEALILISCEQRPDKATNTVGQKTTDPVVAPEDAYVPQRADYTFRTEVRTINEDDEVTWDTIVVYLTDARGNTEMLYTKALPLDTLYWDKGSIGEITEEDWNFDGFPDLQVCQGPMNSSGNYTYDVWLWDDTVHKFLYFDDDHEIYSPEIDKEKKCIVSTWQLDDEAEIVQYEWKDGKLVETGREQMSLSDLMDE